jgi:hypothetical protein
MAIVQEKAMCVLWVFETKSCGQIENISPHATDIRIM